MAGNLGHQVEVNGNAASNHRIWCPVFREAAAAMIRDVYVVYRLHRCMMSHTVHCGNDKTIRVGLYSLWPSVAQHAHSRWMKGSIKGMLNASISRALNCDQTLW